MSTDDDLRRARSCLAEAELAQRPSDRYLAAHLAALRVVAIVLTCRASATIGRSAGRAPSTGQAWSAGRPQNAWRMLAEVAPELAEWAAFFALPRPSAMPSGLAPARLSVPVRPMIWSGMLGRFSVSSSGQSDLVPYRKGPYRRVS